MELQQLGTQQRRHRWFFLLLGLFVHGPLAVALLTITLITLPYLWRAVEVRAWGMVAGMSVLTALAALGALLLPAGLWRGYRDRVDGAPVGRWATWTLGPLAVLGLVLLVAVVLGAV